tara:strand:+ start:117 stop:488 length:372 start_codon:yes stop_codon:yes gene_type:complete
MQPAYIALICAGLIAMSGFSSKAQENQEDSRISTHQIESLFGSLGRIRKQLDRAEETGIGNDLFRLDYYIDVYGRLPEINIVEGFNLDSGPVRYSVPTTIDLLNASTPERYRQRYGVGMSIPR